MDAFTHMLAGAVIAKATFEPSLGKWGIISGVAVAILPDIDFLLKFINKKLYIKYHRSLANSIFFLLPLSLFWAYVFNSLSGLHNFSHFALLSFLVYCSHIFFDTLNPFGTMIFAPFSNYRFSWDAVYIVDLLFSGLLFFPLIASYVFPHYSRSICYAGLVSLGIYIIFRFINHAKANHKNRQYIKANKLKSDNFASLPHLSPFRWKNIIETEKHIYKGGVNVLKPQHSDNCYKSWPKYSHQNPDEKSDWIQKALELPDVKVYLWFARFPVMKYQGMIDDMHRVAFYDYRFEGFKGKLPFVYVVDFYSNGQVCNQQFSRNWDLRTFIKGKKEYYSIRLF